MQVQFNPIRYAIHVISTHWDSNEVEPTDEVREAYQVLGRALGHHTHLMSDSDIKQIEMWWSVGARCLGKTP